MSTVEIKSVSIFHLDHKLKVIEYNSVDEVANAIRAGHVESINKCCSCSAELEVRFGNVEYQIHVNRDSVDLCGTSEWVLSKATGEYSKIVGLTNKENILEAIQLLADVDEAVVSHFQSAGLN